MMPSRPRFGPLGSLALAALVAGCAAVQQPRPDPFSGSPTDDEVWLTVENNDFRDATIHAVWNGVRRRVGSVTGKSSETFRMDWRSEQIQLAIDFLGGGDYVSETIGVTEGDHLNFVIMPQ